MLRHKKYRTMTATDLLHEYVRLIPTAYVMKGRDPKLLRVFMENNALDAVDVLWAMTEYAETPGARDIPSFIRWANRNSAIFDGDRLGREGSLSAILSSQRIPVSAMPYYDLMEEAIPDARLMRAFRASADSLRTFVAGVLGPA